MRKNKILIIGLALLATALLAVVAVADNKLVLDIKAIEGSTTEPQSVHLQFRYKDDKGAWVVEGNIPNATVGEFTYNRVYEGPHRIEVNKAGWYCENSSGAGRDIGDYPTVVIDKIDVAAYKCTFTLPVFTLAMNFNVHGLASDAETTFYVHQFDKNGTEIQGVIEDYPFGNTWDTARSQDMSLEYAYSEIWQNGKACQFIAGENPEDPKQIGTDIGTVYVTYNTLEENGCVLSLEAPPAPAPVHTMIMNFYVYGLESNDDRTTFSVLQYGKNGLLEGLEKNYEFSNTWPSTETQDMSLEYVYGEIWHNGESCKFVSGENPARIGTDVSEIHVKYNTLEQNACVLSLTPFPLPVDHVNLKMSVNIAGIDDTFTTPAKLAYKIFSSTGTPVSTGGYEYNCSYNNGCFCSDGKTRPTNGFCTEEFVSTYLGNETIELTWTRIKADYKPVVAVCQLNGSSSIPLDDIVKYYYVAGSDPQNPIVCQICSNSAGCPAE
jgi:hypothetical protein